MSKNIEFPANARWYEHYVSYGETDTMGVLYYAEYLHIFERSRSFYIREAGMSYADVEARGILMPVREAQCRYRAPVHFDEKILVHVGITKWKRVSALFEYEVWNHDKSILHATGMTEHGIINREGKPVRVPNWLREL